MGILHYGASGIEIEFEDRVLAHLQIAIGTKLRRHERFFLSWKDDPKVGDGRSSVWLDRSIPLAFTFAGARSPSINPRWLGVLADSVDGRWGMQLADEPGPNGEDGQARDNSMKP
jgi:hypothetical protein